MAKAIEANEVLNRTCKLEGSEDAYYLVRRGKKNSRVLKVGETGPGELVETTKLLDVKDTPAPSDPPPSEN